MNYRLLLTLLILVFISCKKEKDNTQIEAKINFESYELSSLEVVTATYENINPNLAEYPGNLGGKEVKIVVLPETKTLGYMVPDIDAGTYTLNFQIDGLEFSFSFTIKPSQEIDNPLEYIENKLNLNQFSHQSLNTIQANLSTIKGNEDCAENVSRLKTNYDILANQISNASPEEHKTLARFLAANSILFDEIESPNSLLDSFSLGKNDSQTPESILSQTIERANTNWKVLVKVGALGTAALFTANPIIIGFSTFVILHKLFKYNQQNLAGFNKALVRFQDIILNELRQQKKNDPIILYVNKPYSIGFVSQYRNPNKKDVNNPSSTFQAVLSNLSEFGVLWNKINTYASAFLTELSGVPFQITEVEHESSKTFKVAPEFLKIGKISNPNITFKQKTASETIDIEFNTTEIEDQQFTFELIYESEFGRHVQVFNAELRVSAPIVSLQRISNEYQVGKSWQNVQDKPTVRVVDEYGNGISGVLIDWEITRDQYDNIKKQSVTNANGYADIVWGLNDVCFKDQTLLAQISNMNEVEIKPGNSSTMFRARLGDLAISFKGSSQIEETQIYYKLITPIESKEGSWIIYSDFGYSFEYDLFFSNIENQDYNCSIIFNSSGPVEVSAYSYCSAFKLKKGGAPPSDYELILSPYGSATSGQVYFDIVKP